MSRGSSPNTALFFSVFLDTEPVGFSLPVTFRHCLRLLLHTCKAGSSFTSPPNSPKLSQISVTFRVPSLKRERKITTSRLDAICFRIASRGRGAAISTMVSSLESISLMEFVCPVDMEPLHDLYSLPAAYQELPRRGPHRQLSFSGPHSQRMF